MKKTILAAALGIVASVAPAYGQGSIFFNNYGTTTDAIVTYCIPGVADNVPVDIPFKAGLFYSFGADR